MDAEKALIAAHGMTAYAWKPGLCGQGCAICALARAAFEERGHVAGCLCSKAGHEFRTRQYRTECIVCGSKKHDDRRDPRCALPKWLTETSR